MSQTGQSFSTQNTYRGDITGVTCPLERRQFFFSQIFLEEKRKTVELHIWKHDKLLFCLSFAEFLLLIVWEAKSVPLIFSKYLIENIPLTFKKKLHAAERGKARLKSAHGILYRSIEPE